MDSCNETDPTSERTGAQLEESSTPPTSEPVVLGGDDDVVDLTQEEPPDEQDRNEPVSTVQWLRRFLSKNIVLGRDLF